jgi:hypothetical protein
VASNTGAPRSGWVRFIYADGTTFFEVKQASPSHVLAFLLHDPAVSSTAPATECLLKTTSTICTLTAVTATLPNPVTSYDWRVEYAYGGSKVRTQVGSLPAFSFTESCGASAPDGSPITLRVTLKATDSAANSATVTAGEGLQPVLQLRSFNCP